MIFSLINLVTVFEGREYLWPLILINIFSILFITGYKLVRISGVKKSYDLIKKWALTVYIFDTTFFAHIEVISNYIPDFDELI